MAIYKKITLVGTSEESVADAIRGAIKRASATLRNLSWFEVKEIRGRIDGTKVGEFQVVLEVGFKLEDEEPI